MSIGEIPHFVWEKVPNGGILDKKAPEKGIEVR